jgi:hypothetical protein
MKQKHKETIREIVETGGRFLNSSMPLGEPPQNMSKEELRAKYFRPEFWDTPDLHKMSVSELRYKLAELKKICEAAGLSEISR